LSRKEFAGAGRLADPSLESIFLSTSSVARSLEEAAVAKSCLVVRAEVPDPVDRAAFDHWYATDHLPWAIRVFGARRGWRCWSRTNPAVHYAFYEFADVAEAQAATDPDKSAPLVADFDRVWGDRAPRRPEILEIVQEMAS
jgi:hypothetical protein